MLAVFIESIINIFGYIAFDNIFVFGKTFILDGNQRPNSMIIKLFNWG